jgi:protein-disulfide isomerase
MSRDSIAARIIFSGVICLLCVLAPLAAAGPGSDWNRILRSMPTTGDRSLGSADAPVIVLEYASASCPHCAIFHNKSFPQIRRDYVDTGKVRWIFRELPLDELAMAAFMLARCMPEEKYFTTVEALFIDQKLWMGIEPRKAFWQIMQRMGMSQDQFDGCLRRQDLSQSIYQTAKQAVDEFGVKSTPTFFINGERIRGTQEAHYFGTLIEGALRKARQ